MFSQENHLQSSPAAAFMVSHYNIRNYPAIYGRFTQKFKNTLPEKDLFDFFDNSMHKTYGQIDSIKLLRKNSGSETYHCYFNFAQLQMLISSDSAGNISGLSFEALTNYPETKRKSFAYRNPLREPLDSLIHSIVKDYMESPQNCGLSIGIIKEGKHYFYNYGETQKGNKVLPDSSSIYEIGSLSKVFCGYLLAGSVIEGKVKSNDDIRKFLKSEYPNLHNAEPVQLVHLSNHTSGLPRLPADIDKQTNFEPLNPYKNYTREMLLTGLRSTSLQTRPGSLHAYSNLGFGLLGIILENVYNSSYHQLLEEKLEKSLSLKDTKIQLDKSRLNRLCTGYSASGSETPYWELDAMVAAGGVHSTSNDLLLYLHKNLQGLDPALKLAMKESYSKDQKMGMAWFINETKQGNNMHWHNGGTFGFSSFMGMIDHKKCAVVVLSNSASPVDFIALKILKHLQN